VSILLIVIVIIAVAALGAWLASRQAKPDAVLVDDGVERTEEETRWAAIGLALTNLADSVRHTRRLARVSVVLVIIDLVLSVFFAVSIVQSHEATHKASVASHAALVASSHAEDASRQAVLAAKAARAAKHSAFLVCEAGNAFRVGDQQLWDFLFSLFPPNPNETTSEAQRLASFKAFLKVHDAPHVCTDG
jgi:hypothetical protein